MIQKQCGCENKQDIIGPLTSIGGKYDIIQTAHSAHPQREQRLHKIDIVMCHQWPSSIALINASHYWSQWVNLLFRGQYYQ